MSATTHIVVGDPGTQHEAGTRRVSGARVARIAVMIAVALFFVLPIIGFVALSFRNHAEMANGEGGFLGLFGMSFQNFIENWKEIDRYGAGGGGLFRRWMQNSLIVSVGGAVLALLTAIPAGYAFARLRFPFRRALLITTLIAMVMPNTVLVIPLFMQVSAINAVGQLWPVLIIMGFYPFGVYLSYIHFSTTMPAELVEAARLDGLSEVGTFMRIALPISKQAIALVTFFSFVANWTNFFLPLALLTSNPMNKTVSIGIQELIGSSPLFNPTLAAGLDVKLYLPHLAIATFVSMIPLLILFLGAQRFLMRGQTVGAVKG